MDQDSKVRTISEAIPDETIAEDAAIQNRKRIKPSSRIAAQPCWDWMVTSGNTHYAKDLTSFTSYTPISTTISHNVFSPTDELQVTGVGTVELEVQRSPTDLDTHVIILEDVLHIPDALCNGFNPLLYGSSMSCHTDIWEGRDAKGTPVWYSTPFAGASRLALAQRRCGGSELIDGNSYSLSLYITLQEKTSILSQAAEGRGDVNGMVM